MPVLPLVGSTITVLPGVIRPSRSAASIIARPMRSFTLSAGFWLSSFTTICAGAPAQTRFSRTSGVRPTSSVTLAAIRIDELLAGARGIREKRASGREQPYARGSPSVSRAPASTVA